MTAQQKTDRQPIVKAKIEAYNNLWDNMLLKWGRFWITGFEPSTKLDIGYKILTIKDWTQDVKYYNSILYAKTK